MFPLQHLALFLTFIGAPMQVSALQRLPLLRETPLSVDSQAGAVILVPDEKEYKDLGEILARALAQSTGVRIQVKTAQAVLPDQHLILLGQFWNNPALARLYNACLDPTDAFFPGPGGFELRTVCSPFVHGQNCIVATGSDLEGCRKAVVLLPELIQKTSEGAVWPFLHEIHMGKLAEEEHQAYVDRMKPIFSEIDRYAQFMHPEPKTWWGEDPHNLLTWKDRNLAVSASLALRIWASGDPQSLEAFKSLVLGCAEEMEGIRQAYKEARGDLAEYSLFALTLGWDLIEEMEGFSEEERTAISNFLYEMAVLNKDQYFMVKCKDTPVNEVMFWNRHQIAGTLWMGLEGEYLARNFKLSEDQSGMSEKWQAHANRYLERLSQSYFYSDGGALMNDEGGMVLRMCMMKGLWSKDSSDQLRLLADYFVASHDNLGRYASNGHNGSQQNRAIGGEILNAASWLCPGEGYGWFRRRLGPSPYSQFMFYMAYGAAVGLPYFNWETPVEDDGSQRLKDRMTGVFILPLGLAWYEFMEKHPDMFEGGYQRTPGRFHYDSVPYEKTWKRIALRSGLEPNDQYLLLDGLQGIEWSYDDIQSIISYTDLGQPLLKSQWDGRAVESRLDMNSLFVSRGRPGQKQSVASECIRAVDAGSHAILSLKALQHDGMTWTRHIFWHKGEWILIADEIQPQEEGSAYVAQTWLSPQAFSLERWYRPAAQAGNVSLFVRGHHWTYGLIDQGIRGEDRGVIRQDRSSVYFTLLSARSQDRPRGYWMEYRDLPRSVVVISDHPEEHPAEVAFLERWDGENLRIRAETGLLARDRVVLSGVYECSYYDDILLSSDQGLSLSWDLENNKFETGRQGFALTELDCPGQLRRGHRFFKDVLARCADSESSIPTDHPRKKPPKTTVPGFEGPELKTLAEATLKSPVSLACEDLKGQGNLELVLYDDVGQPRFDFPETLANPVALDAEGNGLRHIVLAGPKCVRGYSQTGDLLWTQPLPNDPMVLSAGDLDQDGKDELGILMDTWAMVIKPDGRRLIDEDIYKYKGIGAGFGDVDADGEIEFVAVTSQGVNVLKPGQTRRTSMFGQFFGSLPVRLWLKDLDKDGVAEGVLGGGGSDLTCYDLRSAQRRWTLRDMPIHPACAAMADVNGDGISEILSGAQDGFLVVVDKNGQFLFSKAMGAGGMTAMEEIPEACSEQGRVAMGFESGLVLLVDASLKPVGHMLLSAPVQDLAYLSRVRGPGLLVAVDQAGRALFIESL